MWVLALIGCGPQTEVLLDADPARLGGWGELGPAEVRFERRSAVARVEERLAYDWIAPAEHDAVVLFAHGGLVDRSRSRWLGVHLASRGVAFAAPAHDLDLAITDPSNLTFVADDLERRGELVPAATAGHSLGGVIASWSWQDDPRVEGLLLLASFPAGEGPVPGAGPVLSISGTTDGSALPAEVSEGAARYEASRLALVDGMNHYAWTDDPSPGELEGDGPLTRPLEDVRTDALRVIDTWIDAFLRDDPEALERLEQPFSGVTP